MGRMAVGAVRKRRKPASHKTLDTFADASQPQQEQHQHQDWHSTNPFDNISSKTRDDDQEPPSSTLINRRNSDLDTDDSMSMCDGPSGRAREQQQQQQQQQPFSSLHLDNIGSELHNPGFDPLTSMFHDIDFSDIDDRYFEVGETSPDPAFPGLTTTQCPPTSPTQPQGHIQPQQRNPELQIQTTKTFDTPSSTTTQSYQDSGVVLHPTTSTPSSLTDGTRYWTTQLEELSRTPHESPIPLDLMLHHSSRLLPRVAEALGSHHSADVSSSATNLILILVCLIQVIALFEQCIPSILEGRYTTGASHLSLRLGEFQIDREAQQALQMHVVNKELSTILRVSKLIRQTWLRPEWCGVSKSTHGLLLDDLQVRTKTLVYQMTRKRGASRIVAL